MSSSSSDVNSKENGTSGAAGGILAPLTTEKTTSSESIKIKNPQQQQQQQQPPKEECVDSTTASVNTKSSSPTSSPVSKPPEYLGAVLNNTSTSSGTGNGTNHNHGLTPSNSSATIKSSNNSPSSSHRRNSSAGKIPNLVQQYSAMSVGSIDDIDRLDRSNRSYFSSTSFRKHQRTVVPHPNSNSASNSVADEKSIKGRKYSSGVNVNAGMGIGNASTYTPPKTGQDDGDKVKFSPQYFENVKVPKMKDVSRCNLFCAFYAEFDNIVGPKVSYQAPRYFMDHDVAITTEEIESLLTKSFKSSSSSASPPSSSGHDTAIPVNNEDQDMNRNDAHGKDGGEPSNDVEKGSSSSRHDRNNQKSGKTSKTQTNQSSSSRKPIVPPNSQSIFDSTCEYIITGNELSGQLISLSTHNMHIIAKPTIIQNEKYERNSLLFSVGFVIRRNSDPYPFRSLLSRLASTLRSMEIESGFLSSPTSKPRIQRLLNVIVSSLNSPSSKCHLLLDDANFLHLQYFPPPRTHAPPVPDYAVPILLRPEYMLKVVDWDLTIAWIVPYIDGVKHAKLIAKSSKVDEEVVLSCLRVLRHHNVLAYIDMFRYSNIYESTLKSQQLVAGEMDDLLLEAFRFVSKQNVAARSSSIPGYHSVGSGNLASSFKSTKSVRVGNTAGVNNTANESKILLAPISGPSSYPPVVRAASFDPKNTTIPEQPLASSYTSSRGIYNDSPTPSCNTPNSKSSSNAGAGLLSPQRTAPPLSVTPSTPGSTSFRVRHPSAHMERERKTMMTALAILYASCQRGMTLSDVWTRRVKRTEQSETEDNLDPVSCNGGHSKKKKKKQNNRSTGKHRSSSYGSTSSANDSIGTIDWAEVFNYFDHRRFVTFGIIHGLISRVHEYPFVCDEWKDDDSEKEEMLDPVTEPPASSLRLVRRKSTLRTQNISPNSPPQLQPLRSGNMLPFLCLDSISPVGSVVMKQDSIESHTNPAQDHLYNAATPKSSHAMQTLSKKIALSMDGTRCDDELSGMFQKSMKELKDLVRRYSKKEVMSMYSTTLQEQNH